jgi:hypothetical protein
MAVTAEDYWAQIRGFKAEADSITQEIRILELRRSDLANRMHDAYERLTVALEVPE